MIVFVATALTGCVTTAQCDEFVDCPGDEVCFQSECKQRCGAQERCADDESCLPCYEEGDDRSGAGRCLGVDDHVCVSDQ